MTQLALDLRDLTVPDYAPEATLAERFAAFHEANPHVADALEHLAQQWLSAGHRKVGMKALVERLRWESGIRVDGSGAYKLNNSLVSFYSRLLIERRPEWADCIETRRAQADES